MTRRLLAAALLASVTWSSVQAQAVVEAPTVNRSAPIVIQLDGIPTSALVVMLLRDVMRVPYVIAPDVLANRRPTSVRLVIPRNRVPETVVTYLRRSGFAVQLEGGTVYVSRPGSYGVSAGASAGAPGPTFGGSSVPLGSPLGPAPIDRFPQSDRSVVIDPTDQNEDLVPLPIESESGILAYIPAHRPPDYFAAVITPLLPDLVFGARPEQQADIGSLSMRSELGPELLLMSGSPDDLAKARRLVETLDRPRPMVAVKAVVMQMADVKVRGSALSVLANLVNGKLGFGSFGADAPASQFVRIGSGAVSAVLSAVREDSRFRVVATPNLAALSGAVATMNAGAQVPTLGNVTVTEGGVPVQSVVYRDSGITLTVRPIVRGELIELAVEEERSTFVRTTTGVEDSPTLQKSSARASVTLVSGESVVLAGLTEARDDQRREGLLGGLLGIRSRDKSDTELLVLLQAELVPSPVVAPGQFVPIFDPEQEETEDAPTDPLAAA